jgi:hypothetical protein
LQKANEALQTQLAHSHSHLVAIKAEHSDMAQRSCEMVHDQQSLQKELAAAKAGHAKLATHTSRLEACTKQAQQHLIMHAAVKRKRSLDESESENEDNDCSYVSGSRRSQRAKRRSIIRAAIE